jgi:hypothetical protein
MMKTIGDLLNRDLSRKIEEIIQVDQADEQSVHDEITEYVATGSIREQYHQPIGSQTRRRLPSLRAWRRSRRRHDVRLRLTSATRSPPHRRSAQGAL